MRAIAQRQLQNMLSRMSGEERAKVETFIFKMNQSEQLGQVALRRGLITHKQLAEALIAQKSAKETEKEPIGQILLKNNALTETGLHSILDP